MVTSERSATPEILIRPSVVVGWLSCAILILVSSSFLAQIAKFWWGHDNLMGLLAFTNVDAESNLPTWYSSTALIGCVLATAIIAAVKRQTRDPYARYWALLVLVFLYMSLDETGQVHEMVGRAVRQVGQRNEATRAALPNHMWPVVFSPIVAVVGMYFVRFLWALPRTTRYLLIAGGTIFLTGALGFEVIGNHHRDRYGIENLGYVAIMTVEESLEMVGVVVALYGLLDYLERHITVVRIRIGGPAPATFGAADGTELPQAKHRLRASP